MISPRDFTSIAKDLEKERIALALSGGADSMCLCLLFLEWGKFSKFAAVTVNHNLRENSLEEALKVAAWTAALGVEHHILTWRHEVIKTAIQESARNARYELLFDFCREHNFSHLVTAHNSNDQVETFLMRLNKGSSLSGLCVMKEKTKTDFGWLVRPLLNTSRKSIEETLLTRFNHPFIHDSSNDNLNFERVRLRKKIPEILNAESALKSLDHIQKAQSFIDAQILEAVDKYLSEPFLNFEIISQIHPFLCIGVLRNILQKIGKAQYPPSPAALDRLLQKLKNEAFKAATLSGCILKKGKDNKIIIIKENRPKK